VIVGGQTYLSIQPMNHPWWRTLMPTATRRLHTHTLPAPPHLASATHRRRIRPRHHDADAPAARIACCKHAQHEGAAGRRRCESARATNSISSQVEAIYERQYTANICSDTSFEEGIMKTIIQIHKEGEYFVAIDLVTNVADQGLTEEEAIRNLIKGLEEHYQILMELSPKDHKISFIDIEVERYAQTSSPVV